MTTPAAQVGRDGLTVGDPRRWWALAAVATAQLMLAVDGTIMNIALPSTTRDLALSGTATQWVVTAYVLSFGALLLLGGRIGQRLGYRRALLLGLTGFALASLMGGLAVSGGLLIGARTAQGVFGALMTPAALALLSTTFPATERGRAFGIFSTIMGSGSAIGVIAGGLLTEYLSWRWAMFVNVPIAGFALLVTVFAVRSHRDEDRSPIDLTGALLATAGLCAVVYGLSAAKTHAWSGPGTLVPLSVGVVLLTAFVVVESRRRAPLFPLSLLRNRPRSAAYLAMLAWGIAIVSAFLFLSFFLQDVLGYGAARAGLAFLPYPLAIQLGVRVVRRRMTQLQARTLLTPGLALIGAGLFLLSRLTVDASYLPDVVVVFLLLGLGTSLVLPVTNSTVTLGAGPHSGVAAAMGATSQQIGAGLGTAWLTALAASAAASYGGSARDSAAYGYTQASLVAGGTLIAAALIVWFVAGRARRS
ncbi:MAG: hypothetical protein QOH50_3584 [Kribbellaceae bacterium]|nr:hypothetical protein [Kribbellaceae bacterium]